MAGYSKRTLKDKLGIKAGFKIHLIHPPENYDKMLGDLPTDVNIIERLGDSLDFVQMFTKDKEELESQFPAMKQSLAPDGMLWISWPKKASKIETDLNENVVRDIGLRNGMVDVKVIAVDETWSGLKFVYRLKDRK